MGREQWNDVIIIKIFSVKEILWRVKRNGRMGIPHPSTRTLPPFFASPSPPCNGLTFPADTNTRTHRQKNKRILRLVGVGTICARGYGEGAGRGESREILVLWTGGRGSAVGDGRKKNYNGIGDGGEMRLACFHSCLKMSLVCPKKIIKRGRGGGGERWELRSETGCSY